VLVSALVLENNSAYLSSKVVRYNYLLGIDNTSKFTVHFFCMLLSFALKAIFIAYSVSTLLKVYTMGFPLFSRV
jgi:hypothetical protein